MPDSADRRSSTSVRIDAPVVLALLRLQHQLERTLAEADAQLDRVTLEHVRRAPPRRPRPRRDAWDGRPVHTDASWGADRTPGPV
jgi:hypothetical protein